MSNNVVVDYDPDTGEPVWLIVGSKVYGVIGTDVLNDLAGIARRARQASEAEERMWDPDYTGDEPNWEALDDERGEFVYQLAEHFSLNEDAS